MGSRKDTLGAVQRELFKFVASGSQTLWDEKKTFCLFLLSGRKSEAKKVCTKITEPDKVFVCNSLHIFHSIKLNETEIQLSPEKIEISNEVAIMGNYYGE